MDYQQQTLTVMNGVELVVALYDGMIRFLHNAIGNIEAGEVVSRRQSIGHALDILTYLQARLRPDIGGESAVVLSEFYAAMYSQCVRASRDASVPLCKQTIADIRNVRDAWQKASESENSTTELARDRQWQQYQLETRGSSMGMPIPQEAMAAPASNRWSA